MSFQKVASYTKTYTKAEIEAILKAQFEKELNQQDKDFRLARWIQSDFTYTFKDNNPTIDVCIIIDDTKMRP